jgi:hypothetical protein
VKTFLVIDTLHASALASTNNIFCRSFYGTPS